MTLADIPHGSAVFVDANTFVYHFISEPTYGGACTSFLERIERQEIEGWVSPHILAEASHRLMTIEACSVFGWPYQGIAARLRRHPQHFQQLNRFRQALAEIQRLGLRVVTVTEQHVVEAANLSQRFRPASRRRATRGPGCRFPKCRPWRFPRPCATPTWSSPSPRAANRASSPPSRVGAGRKRWAS